MKRGWMAGLALVGLIVSSGGVLGGERLSHNELGRLFPGSFYAVVNGSLTMNIVARANGTLSGKVAGYQDTGRWSVQAGRLCIAWNKWLNGKTTCSAVVDTGAWYQGSGVRFKKL
jgi:hypothetical protein